MKKTRRRGGVERLQQVVSDEPAGSNESNTVASFFFFLSFFLKPDLPLTEDLRATHMSGQHAIKATFMNLLSPQSQPVSENVYLLLLIKQLACLELLKETTAGGVIWWLITFFGSGGRD